MIGGIEAGGTKIICGVAEETNVTKVVASIVLPTLDPAETIPKIIDFFKKYQVDTIAIGSFGPIDINKASSTYGYITNTPKMAWKHFDFLGTMKEALPVRYVWTTDVNAAAFGEMKYGAAKGDTNCVYLTVGTGIGGGIITNGHILEGITHPEVGHIYVKKHPDDDFNGVCSYHGDCLEGLAAGPSIEGRYNMQGQQLESTDPAWDIEAFYLAQGCMNYTLSYAPEKIIFGGGVMKQLQLFPKIREQFSILMNDYVNIPDLEEYIVPCALRDQAGIIGCLALAASII